MGLMDGRTAVITGPTSGIGKEIAKGLAGLGANLVLGCRDAAAGKAHWNTVQPLIVRARESVKFHFAVEESLMQIVNYPQFAAHRAEHLYVLKQFAALEHRVLRQEMKAELMPLISAWLFHHMIESDQPFGRYALGFTSVSRAA